jgi:hypothetical protein
MGVGLYDLSSVLSASQFRDHEQVAISLNHNLP